MRGMNDRFETKRPEVITNLMRAFVGTAHNQIDLCGFMMMLRNRKAENTPGIDCSMLPGAQSHFQELLLDLNGERYL